MQGLLTALGCGFKKWVGWKRLGVAASLLIIAFAITTLVRTLKGVDTAVTKTSWPGSGSFQALFLAVS